MNQLALTSSTGIAPFNNYSSLLESAHSNGTQQFSSRSPYDFQPKIKSPAYILGEQLAYLAEKVWKIAFDVYAKFPSFSFPVAAASAAPKDPDSNCLTPTGSYENSCNRPVVIYLPDEDQCELTTRCATFYDGLAHRQTSIRFSPRDSTIALANLNGTLVAQRSREESINARFAELFETAATPEDLLLGKEKIIGSLHAGDVITINSELQPSVLSPDKWVKNNNAFDSFLRISKGTGGFMGHSRSPASLNPLLELIILKVAAESSGPIDIAFVLDTTSSMEPHIAQVKNNLVQFLAHLQERKKENNPCRVAILEYRDRDDFLNRVDIGFTSNLDQADTTVRGLRTAGGGDEPEAVLDGLLKAKNNLSWNPRAKRVVILIGDAPPHPTTSDGLYDEADVIEQFQTAGTEIAVYPVLSESM